jgi:phosphoenolpyruvate-protein kinase (PTS system EI component)
MSARELRGLAAAPGVAVGSVRLLETPEPDDGAFRGHALEQARALAALEREADELRARADRLRSDGLAAEAEILEANRLIALDPLLQADVERLTRKLTATEALRVATDRSAELLAALPDPLLAARAADVRELGRRTARILAGGPKHATAGGPTVLVAHDLGPADVAELRESGQTTVGIALAAGAATSHAAIMARSLGLPMVVGAGDALLAAVDSTTLVVDGDEGIAYLEPDDIREAWARAQMNRLAQAQKKFARERALPPVTRDGHWITLLGNAATAVEVRAVLAAEAEGIGLLRTELAFLDAQGWPSEEQHAAALAPLLALLHGQVATVRVLDFGEDKTPPFLAGTEARGIALLLEHPDALAAQLRALVRVAGDAALRVLVPLVETPAQLRAVRTLLRAAGGAGETTPLGAMIETPEAAHRVRELALDADFISIGTNDLVQYTLGLDRTKPLATARSAADPAVLRLVAETVAGAHDAGLTVEVCGEAASVPELAVIFVGLGVDELSVSPAGLDEVRSAVRAISAAAAGEVAARALCAASADEAIALAQPLLSDEARDEQSELFGGLDGVVA